MRRFFSLFLILFFVSQLCAGIPSPDDFLKFPIGADRKLADYHQIVDYFELLDQQSQKLKLVNLGKTTENNDMVLAIISSDANMSQLDKYQQISQKLAHPASIDENELEQLISDGKAIAFITNNIHSTEIGASQMCMEFAYELLTRTDDEVQFYLDNVILLLMPSANPDGQLMVTDWYRKWVGTKYEGGSMPWLYHKYVGHDTNRDFFMLNQKESKLINRVMSQTWFPQVHLDEHQMGSSGPRMFVPPYKDPMSPNLSPILMRLEALYGSNMSFRLEEGGKSGVIDSWAFDSYWPGGTRTAAWKNIVSLLTEMASCRIASPIFIDPVELSAGRKGLVDYKQQVNFPNPWPGGWWRLRDIIDYELIASYSFLETTAKFREDILRAFYTMNLESIEKGKIEPPYAFVLPTQQHDAITTAKLVEILIEHGIDVFQADEQFVCEGKIFDAGSFVVPLAQPLRPFINELMDIQQFPEIRLSSDGDPLPPYDVTAWSLPIQMGVNCQKLNNPFTAKMTELDKAPYQTHQVASTSQYGYAISRQFNNTSIAINRLLKKKIKVSVATQGFTDSGKTFPPGTILISEKNAVENLKNLANEFYLPIHPMQGSLPDNLKQLKPVRLGVYKPWQASMDEGWTRWLLEQYEFDIVSVDNAMIKKGDLNKNFDVLLFADIRKGTIINPSPEGGSSAKYYRPMPNQYEGGIGKEGVKNLKSFVQKGGTLITLDGSCELPIDEFPLPASNTIDNISRNSFSAPGVMVKMTVDTSHPIGWGMPETFAGFISRSPAFRASSGFDGVERTIVARYPDEPLLISGWIKGEEYLRRKASIVDFKFGEGNVVLLGFRVQHRAQPHGTFKLLFNSIFYNGLAD